MNRHVYPCKISKVFDLKLMHACTALTEIIRYETIKIIYYHLFANNSIFDACPILISYLMHFFYSLIFLSAKITCIFLDMMISVSYIDNNGNY